MFKSVVAGVMLASIVAGAAFIALPDRKQEALARERPETMRNVAFDIRAHWAISAAEAKRQRELGVWAAIAKSDDSYGAPSQLYTTRQQIKYRSPACLTPREGVMARVLPDSAECRADRGAEYKAFRRPFAFYTDGSHQTVKSGAAFNPPLETADGAKLLSEIIAVPRLKDLEVDLTVGFGSRAAQTWHFVLSGAELTAVQSTAVTPVAASQQAAVDAGSCRPVHDAQFVDKLGQLQRLKLIRTCLVEGQRPLLVVYYHRTQSNIQPHTVADACGAVLLKLNVGPAKSADTAACIGARWHEVDAADVDITVFDKARDGTLRSLRQ